MRGFLGTVVVCGRGGGRWELVAGVKHTMIQSTILD